MNKENTTSQKVRTRFAPSPTGSLHLGGVRTALFSYLLAKKHGGSFLLRIEDTDQKRSVAGADEEIRETLAWLGLHWSGEVRYQSQHLEHYQQYAYDLVRRGHAYYCFCSAERLEVLRAEQQKRGTPVGYDGKCLSLSQTAHDELLRHNEEHVIRLKVPESGIITFQDAIRGGVSFDLSFTDDQVLIKSDGFPTYHLASVVDDYEQGITHVLRGEEWLSSTPKHIVLYQAFGWQVPTFAHLPVIVGKDKKKLSKRDGSVSAMEYKDKGYLPEALLNFLALLGWNPGGDEEFFTLRELESVFDVTRVHKAPAVFDVEKLNHINAHYMRRVDISVLAKMVVSFSKKKLEKYDTEYLEKVLKVSVDRMTTLKDFDEVAGMFFAKISYDTELLKFKKSLWADTEKGLGVAVEALTNVPGSAWKSEGVLNDLLTRVVVESGLKNGDVFWSVRVALSGKEQSSSPAELLWVFGRDESIKRLKQALKKIEK